MKNILVADDHPAIRNGVKIILKSEFDEVEFGEASSAAEVFKKLRDKNWDILILDMDMPGRNGLDVIKQLKDEKVKIPVLVFSMHPEEQIAVRSMKAGAAGYLSKDSASEELAKAVHLILSGRKYISPSLAEQLASLLEHPAGKDPHELLSDREYQTMLLIASGKTISQIADELSLSVPTISTYRTRVLEKMNMKNSAELTYYAIKNHLV
ncbi:MAG: response regulator transcription factor [Bacteroidetes bacterium]|nr:response regulator transcription factor [Bacteroidota bacterium]